MFVEAGLWVSMASQEDSGLNVKLGLKSQWIWRLGAYGAVGVQQPGAPVVSELSPFSSHATSCKFTFPDSSWHCNLTYPRIDLNASLSLASA